MLKIVKYCKKNGGGGKMLKMRILTLYISTNIIYLINLPIDKCF